MALKSSAWKYDKPATCSFLNRTIDINNLGIRADDVDGYTDAYAIYETGFMDGFLIVVEDEKLNTHAPDFPDESLDTAIDTYHANCDSAIKRNMEGATARSRAAYHFGFMHAVTQMLMKHRRKPTKCSICDGALVDGKCRFINHQEEKI